MIRRVFFLIYIKQECSYCSRGSRSATRVPFSAREISRALAELRDHAFGLCDLVNSYTDLNIRHARGARSSFIRSASKWLLCHCKISWFYMLALSFFCFLIINLHSTGGFYDVIIPYAIQINDVILWGLKRPHW